MKYEIMIYMNKQILLRNHSEINTFTAPTTLVKENVKNENGKKMN